VGVKNEIRPIQVGFNYTLAALSQFIAGQRVPDIIIRGLSKLLPSQVSEAARVWVTLETDARREIATALLDAAESDFELDFTAFGIFALRDVDPEIRQIAINLLNEQINLPHMARLLNVAQHDVSDEVRAAAIQGLAAIILDAELGKLPEAEVAPVIVYLVSLLDNARVDVYIRARALEAIAHSSHEAVTGQIKRAYNSDESRMKTAALVAMGASSDEEIWGETVIQELTSRQPANRYEAARAAGELNLIEAVPKLSRLAVEDEGQIRNIAIWALGEIGGKEATRVLEAMLEQAEEDDDDALIDLLEEAIDAASVADGQVYGFGNDFDLEA
jgi:HEAT repeat protein